jgi:hypothetical protein
MKIYNVTYSSDIVIEPQGDRWYKIPHAFYYDMITEYGRIRISVYKDFMFDGRSGGNIVDFVAPNLGTQEEVKAWLTHDIGYYSSIGLSFEQTNELLYQMLRDCGYGWFRARSIYTAVSMFGEGSFGEPKPNDKEYPNLAKIHMRHYDK